MTMYKPVVKCSLQIRVCCLGAQFFLFTAATHFTHLSLSANGKWKKCSPTSCQPCCGNQLHSNCSPWQKQADRMCQSYSAPTVAHQWACTSASAAHGHLSTTLNSFTPSRWKYLYEICEILHDTKISRYTVYHNIALYRMSVFLLDMIIAQVNYRDNIEIPVYRATLYWNQSHEVACTLWRTELCY